MDTQSWLLEVLGPSDDRLNGESLRSTTRIGPLVHGEITTPADLPEDVRKDNRAYRNTAKDRVEVEHEYERIDS